MSWVDALREYAKTTGKFVVPKRGSPEYEAVRKIQTEMGAKPKPAPTPDAKPPADLGEIKRAKKAKLAAMEPTPEQIRVETAKVKADAKAEAKVKADADAAAKAEAKAAKAAANEAIAAKAAAKANEPKPNVKRSAPRRKAPATVHVAKKDAVVDFA
jgi:hypothetical protein